MKYNVISTLIISSIIALCLIILTASIQYAFYNEVSSEFYKAIAFFASCSIIFGIHVWGTSRRVKSRVHQALFYSLYFEMTGSITLTAAIIFSSSDSKKYLIIFFALQIIHALIFLCDMFIYDEKPGNNLNLTNKEIMKLSKKNPLKDEYQNDSSSNDSANYS